MLKEGYLGGINAGIYPNEEERILVARNRGNDELAPSQELFGTFKGFEKHFMGKGYSKQKARWEAWKVTDFEKRFRREMNNPKSIERMKEIKKMAEKKDVRLICYEKKPPCHRFILMELMNKMRNESSEER